MSTSYTEYAILDRRKPIYLYLESAFSFFNVLCDNKRKFRLRLYYSAAASIEPQQKRYTISLLLRLYWCWQLIQFTIEEGKPILWQVQWCKVNYLSLDLFAFPLLLSKNSKDFIIRKNEIIPKKVILISRF